MKKQHKNQKQQKGKRKREEKKYTAPPRKEKEKKRDNKNGPPPPSTEYHCLVCGADDHYTKHCPHGFKKARKLMTKEELQNHHSRNSRASIKPSVSKQTRFGAPDSDSESEGD